MARRREGERVLGPYRDGSKLWRIVVVGADGQRDRRFYSSEEEAKQVVRATAREFKRAGEKTVQEAREAYERYLRDEKGNKPVSISATVYRLGVFFSDGDLRLRSLTPQKCAGYYEALRGESSGEGRRFSVDSHRNILAEAKSFLKWCAVKKKWMSDNPLDGVEGMGKRKHGKPQLRMDEARKWLAKANQLADAGEAGAVAAMVALMMGMRASEIVTRVVRDLDDDGRLLWIPEAKTEAGKRALEVPAGLECHLRRLAEGREGGALLFGAHWRDWVRKWVQRICREAKVPEVTAHGMRGLHSTLAMANGVTAHVVAASLGHESSTTTIQSYAKPEAVSGARQRQVLKVLEGGRKAS